VRALVGYVPEAALPLIAENLDMDPAALAALMRDSAQFSAPSEARHQLSVCQGAVCIGRGGGDLLAAARGKFAAMPGLTVVAGHCLGQCLQAPAASLDGEVFAPVDLVDLARRVAALEG
jgi:formate dehydrogenase subunit gamma